MAEDMNPEPKLSGRYKIVLGVSLALNLAVVGLLGGAALRHRDGGQGAMRSAGLGAYGLPYMMALPKDERRQVIKAVRSDQGGQLPNREARRALYAEVLSALRAAPFDADLLATSISLQADTTIRVQRSAQTAWLKLVSEMSASERIAYADRVEEVLRRGPRRKK